MNVRMIVAGLAALAFACAPAGMDGQRTTRSGEIDAPRYSGYEVGPTPVGSIPDVRLADKERNKDVELTIDYPTRGGSHPLIVLSPGYGGSHRGYVGLSTYWAGNDYVVIRVNHADRTANIQNAEDVWANATPTDWRNRVRDITFVLDSIPELVKQFPELEGKIDATKIAVAGHSYGAHTAMLLAGARTFPGGVSYADPRVKAILAMSPQGPSEQRGFTSESWAEVKVPAMFMTGSEDQGTTEMETPEWRSQAFRLSPAGDKWLVTFAGARQATFAGGTPGLIEQIARERAREDIPVTIDPDPIPGMAPRGTDMIPQSRYPRSSRTEQQSLRQRDIFASIRGVALTFFDAYLRGDAEARAALDQLGGRNGVIVEKK